MNTTPFKDQTAAFKIGWWILFALSALSILNHGALLFFLPGEEVLFLGWTAFNVFSTVVLLSPYRRLEKWAWYLTWVPILAYGIIFLFDSSFGIYYLTAAGLMAFGQLLAGRSFNK